MKNDTTALHHHTIYTVSELTAEIKTLLEETYSMVWITGEISNFSRPASGHYYFVLKDPDAQIQAVMFRGQNRRLAFLPKDGMQLTGLGRISIYEPRGTYQIILEHVEPKGVGALQIAFEQLKARLSDAGLFDADRKRPIPYLPGKIAVVTSPTGAVVHDIIHIVRRRFPSSKLVIAPVTVQGDEAITEISEAIQLLNQMPEPAQVIILARGGGSLEDLQAFNSEAVARAIFSSEIPIVSAVGHETDFTIADFVADLRAPTPSAAAELVVPDQFALMRQHAALENRLKAAMTMCLAHARDKLTHFAKRLRDPRKRIEDYRIRLDDYSGRMQRLFSMQLNRKTELLGFLHHRLLAGSPGHRAKRTKALLEQYDSTIYKNMYKLFSIKKLEHQAIDGKLQTLNPRAILQRGYSITRTLPKSKVVRNSAEINKGQKLEVLLSKGSITCCVKEIYQNDEEKF